MNENYETEEVREEIEIPRVGRQFTKVAIDSDGKPTISIANNKSEYKDMIRLLSPCEDIPFAYIDLDGKTVFLFKGTPRVLGFEPYDKG